MHLSAAPSNARIRMHRDGIVCDDVESCEECVYTLLLSYASQSGGGFVVIVGRCDCYGLDVDVAHVDGTMVASVCPDERRTHIDMG